jgi:hypothetical protein
MPMCHPSSPHASAAATRVSCSTPLSGLNHDGASQNNVPSVRPLNGYSRSSGSYVIDFVGTNAPHKVESILSHRDLEFALHMVDLITFSVPYHAWTDAHEL